VHKFWPEDLRDEIHRVTQTTPSVTSQLPGLPLLSKKDEDVDETTKGSIEQTAMQVTRKKIPEVSWFGIFIRSRKDDANPDNRCYEPVVII